MDSNAHSNIAVLPSSRLITLPAELPRIIYEFATTTHCYILGLEGSTKGSTRDHAARSSSRLTPRSPSKNTLPIAPYVLACKQIHTEALPVVYNRSYFLLEVSGAVAGTRLSAKPGHRQVREWQFSLGTRPYRRGQSSCGGAQDCPCSATDHVRPYIMIPTSNNAAYYISNSAGWM